MKKKLALIVTFNSPSNFCVNLDTFYSQFEQIIIIDNGSNWESRRLLEIEAQKRNHSLTVLFNKTNLGIATALNQGFQWAIEQGYQQIFAFDQDSSPAPGMVSAMLDVFANYSHDDTLAMVSPVVLQPVLNDRVRYLRPKNKLLFERASCDGDVLENVTYVITSGVLYDLVAYQKIGPFRDDFFIDYVDIEYCLRAKKRGYKIIVACNAHLHHNLGNQQRKTILGRIFYPTFHSTYRWYYMSRNRISVLRNYALQYPHWFLFELAVSFNNFLRMLLFEDQRWPKFKSTLFGTLDGLLGRGGVIPNTIKKFL